jgi:hypothetical protein
MPTKGWNTVESDVARIVTKSTVPFDPKTVANTGDLISTCRLVSPLPSQVTKGYWSTVSLSWPKFEIEVFEDRLEVYHFNDDGSTEIWYEEHYPGGAFSKRFLDELPKLP